MITESKIMKRSHGIEVLLVDDDPADVELACESLRESKVALNLSIANNGEEALNFLFKKDAYTTAPTPDIILLDLNMPKKSGKEVLKEIKKDEHLKKIPVVVLTTSDAHEDIHKSYDLGANCYVKKPVGLAEFEKVVRALENFWFTVVKLPSN